MKSYKFHFPFKIAATSFILPVKEDNLVSNVKFLKDSFDTVQLLFFGREYLDEVMSPRIINELKAVGAETGLGYTVHLPADLELLQQSDVRLDESIGVIKRIIDETATLDVEGYVLHMDKLEKGSPAVELDQDSISLYKNALGAMTKRLGADARNILIENTTYDLTYFSGIIIKSGYHVCMDAGHLMMQDLDFGRFINIFGERIRQIHLHGLSGGRDHRAFAGLDEVTAAGISDFLKSFTGTAVLEVYNLDDLVKSAAYLEMLME